MIHVVMERFMVGGHSIQIILGVVLLIGCCVYHTNAGSCVDTPCQNEATCVEDNSNQTFTCLCNSGYTGELCENLIDLCQPNPCYNDGTCVKVVEGFRCICGEHHIGTRCEAVKRYCVSENPCSIDALCEDVHDGGYQCFCTPGYYGNHCETEINECDSTPCTSNGTCIDKLNGYECYCLPGREGSRCEIQTKKTCASGPCQNGATCTEDPDGDGYTCICPSGFEGFHCQNDIDDCVGAVCESYQVCIDLENDFRCDCPPGRIGLQCENIIDACVSDPCLNSATCVHDEDRYKCQCPEGYAGMNCEVQTDVCYPNPCLHQSTCITDFTLEPGFSCECKNGFLGDRCEGKITSCQSAPCLNGGTCLENLYEAGYKCLCDSLYAGSQCETYISGCILTGCHNGGACVENETESVCQCTDGWTGETCNSDVNECSLSPCQNGGQCVNLPGTYLCVCPPYWTGDSCVEDILECATSPCKNNGTCEEVVGGPVTCLCIPGTTGDVCETRTDDCSPNPCRNGGSCYKDLENFTCACLPGFDGVYCQTNVDNCELMSPCDNNATCINMADSYKCECRSGFIGVNCSTNVNDCDPEPCLHDGRCIDGENDYKCECTPGFKGKKCEEEIKPCSPSPCLHGGTCTQLDATKYRCACIHGVYGDLCQFVALATFDGRSIVKVRGHKKVKRSVRDLESSADIGFVQTVTMEEVQSLSRIKRQTVYPTKLNLWFSSSILEGTFLLMTGMNESGNNTHFFLKLADKKLIVSGNLYGDTVSDTIDLIPTNQIVSHDINIDISPSQISVSLSDCVIGQKCHVTLLFDSIDQSVDLNGPITLGGIDHVTPYLRSKLKSTHKYTGCLGNLTIDGSTVSLWSVDTENQSSLPEAGCLATNDLCAANQCQNGGNCLNLWSTSQCECPSGFIGPFCELQNSAQFTVDSFLHYGKYLKLEDISIWLTPRSQSGIILYTLDNNPFALYMENGYLFMYLVYEGVDYSRRIGYIDPADWLHISVTFRQDIYRVVLKNSTLSVTGNVVGTMSGVLDVRSPLFFGQLHDHPSLDLWRSKNITLTTSFDGCMRNVSLNGVSIDLLGASPSVFGNDPEMPLPGCSREDKCSLLPCQHGGTCISQWDEPMCECVPSFTGSKCEHTQEVTFNGETSYIEIQLDTTLVPFGDFGSFQFRTRDQTATLFYVEFDNETSLEISLYRGSLQVTFSSGPSLNFGEILSDALWHSVTWVRGYDLLTVYADSRSLSLANVFDPFIYPPVIKIYFGGKPYQPGNPSFIIGMLHGCLRNITFNDEYVPYLNDQLDNSTNGLSVYRKDIALGCHGDDMCKNQPCPVNAVCEDMWNTRTCSCYDGWEGSMCETSINDCSNHLCIHGKCVDGHRNYTCSCNHGYTGQFCDIIFNPCDPNPCFVNGTAECVVNYTLSDMFECKCQPGWSGTTCLVPVNECESSPCLNGALCRDMVNGYICDCVGNYVGDRCEGISVCSTAPCYNGGTCIPNDNNINYTCVCLERYSGKQCQHYNFCYENPCENNSTCVIGSYGYTCECLSQNYGVYCQYVDYCFNSPCLNDAVCHNDKNSFRCTCTKFYTGITCDTPVNLCDRNLCENGATCFQDDVKKNDYICKCREGFSGLRCEIDINECESNPCKNGGTCTESGDQEWNFFPGFHCECPLGFYGDQCENETNECEGIVCENDGTCIDYVNGYECKCAFRFTGDYCEVDQRGCSSSPCFNNALWCVEETNGYRCVCDIGFEGDRCEVNIDDCVDHNCTNGATCVDENGWYSCSCLPGYVGEFCEYVKDACYTQPCANNGICVYRGLCSCENVVNSCGWHNETCQKEACSKSPECLHYTESYTCDCTNTGYSGTTCNVDINECLENSTCEHGGVCTNTVGGFTCECTQTGYIGLTCNEDINECDGPDPCYNEGVCENFYGSFKCLCPAGWTGQTCGQLIDHCKIGPCLNGGQCVNSRAVGFMCDCTGTGFQGDLCQVNINNCVEGTSCLNDGRCIDGVNSFTCDCSGTGFHGNNCEIDTDYCAGSPCENNGTCKDTGLSFECLCGEGFYGETCGVDIDECEGDHKCVDTATCVNTPGSYVCVCSDTFTGQFCEIKLEMSATTSRNTVAITTSVIILLIIILILIIYFCWYIRRSRRMKGKYKPSQMERSMPTVSPGIPLHKIIDPSNGERLV